MVGSIRTTVPASPNVVFHLQRLQQAAGFSMVTFDTDDDPSGQTIHGSGPKANEASGIAHRMASMIDECTAAVTSYLRPAI